MTLPDLGGIGQMLNPAADPAAALEQRLMEINQQLMAITQSKSDIFERGTERNYNVGSITGRSNMSTPDSTTMRGVAMEQDLQREGAEIVQALRSLRGPE